MANNQLDTFLAEGAPDSAPAPAPTPEPAAPAPAHVPGHSTQGSTPQQDAKPPAEAKAPATATPEPDDHEPEPPAEGEPIVPRKAYEAERARRQDWKEKAARFEGELAATKRQLEEATRRAQQPPPQQPQYVAPIDPVADPQGFLQRVQNVMLNERLNNSEQMLRREVGAEKVDAAIEDFRQAAQDDPSLFQKLYAQPDPYGWAFKQVERIRMIRDMGDDPSAYRTRIEAEARAKWEAEQRTGNTVTVSPAAGMQPSLATARSVAGRSAPAWSGEPSLEDVVASIQNRKKRTS